MKICEAEEKPESQSATDHFAGEAAGARLPTGESLLTEIGSWLHITAEQRATAGDHKIVMSRMAKAQLGQVQLSLLYHNGDYIRVRSSGWHQ